MFRAGYCFVGVRHPILRQFAVVPLGFVVDVAWGVFLLQEHISRVLLILQNSSDGYIGEVLSRVGFHTHLGELLVCLLGRFSVQEVIVDEPDDFASSGTITNFSPFHR